MLVMIKTLRLCYLTKLISLFNNHAITCTKGYKYSLGLLQFYLVSSEFMNEFLCDTSSTT